MSFSESSLRLELRNVSLNSILGSTYKTVLVNNFNRLHIMASGSTCGEKSGVYKAKKVDIFKPALLCRDYPES